MRFKAIYVAIIGIIVLGALGYFFYSKYYTPLQQEIKATSNQVEEYKQIIAQMPTWIQQREDAEKQLKVVRDEFVKLRKAKFPPIEASESTYAALALHHESMEIVPNIFDQWQQALGDTAKVSMPTAVTVGGVNPGNWPGNVSFAAPTLNSELIQISLGGGGGGGTGGRMPMPGMMSPMPGMMSPMPGMPGMGGMAMPGMMGGGGGGGDSIQIGGDVLTIKGTYREAMQVLAGAGDKLRRLITFDRIAISADGPDLDKLMGVVAGYPDLPSSQSNVTVTVPEATIYYFVEGAAAGGGGGGAAATPGMSAGPVMGAGLSVGGPVPSLMPGPPGTSGAMPMPGNSGGPPMPSSGGGG